MTRPISPEQVAREIDPELAMLLDLPRAELDATTLASARTEAEASFRQVSGAPLAEPEVVMAPGLPGQPAVPVRLHVPAARKLPGAILHIHGGGLVMGSAAGLDGIVSRMAARLGVPIASVEYRLAPEAPFPGPLLDCAAAWLWLIGQAPALSASRLAVMGESAGGGLAAALTLWIRDNGHRLPDGQVLVYPMLDHQTGVGVPPGQDGWPGWNGRKNQFGWGAYLGDQPVPGGRERGWFSPAHAADLSGLPPTFIPVGTLDLFHDECVDFAARLARAGGETRLVTYPGAPHSFQVVPSAVAKRFLTDQAGAVARMLGD